MTDPTLRNEILAMAQGALTLDVAFVGIAGGLLHALEEPHDVLSLAQATNTDLGYVTRWCEAAYAFELLDHLEDGHYVLTDKGRAFLPNTPGTMMPVAMQAVLSAHMSDHAVTGLRTGARPGEQVLGERENIGHWFGPMLEAAFGPLFDAHVLPSVPDFAVLDRPDARAADLACGNGWYLRRLANHFPGLKGVGVDGYAPNIHDAVARAEAEGLSDRLDFAATDVLHHKASEPYHLVALNRALHHVWATKGEVFAKLNEDLAPGGVAVIWEPRWPDSVEALRRPPLRPLAFQNLAEHVQGNHFLRPDEVCDGLRDAGLEPTVHLLLEGREMVITGAKPSR